MKTQELGPRASLITLLRASDICVTYGSHRVLDSVSIELGARDRGGLITALMGPSGIGKTTLLRVIAGLQKPDAGIVEFNGRNVEAGMVGLVGQNYPLLRHRTIANNIELPYLLAGFSSKSAQQRSEELMSELGILECGRRYPIQLSGGQRQRAAIAQKLAVSREIVLLDEPFTGLDFIAVQTVTQMLRRTAANFGATFLLSTHDISSAIDIADQILLLGRDREAEGPFGQGAKIQRHHTLRRLAGTVEDANGLQSSIRSEFKFL